MTSAPRQNTSYMEMAHYPPSQGGTPDMSYPRSSKRYQLQVIQEPKIALGTMGKGKDRKPIDPPPIVRIKVDPLDDPSGNYLQNPYLLMTSRLRQAEEGKKPKDCPEAKDSLLLGQVVSSLYPLKDTENLMGGFFIFGDLSCKQEGDYYLEFILYEMRMDTHQCVQLGQIFSDKFHVYTNKDFPGLQESTFLTRAFSDQGVRIRLRKDSRGATTRKRNNRLADYSQRFNSHDMEKARTSNGMTSNSPYQQALSEANGPSGGGLVGSKQRSPISYEPAGDFFHEEDRYAKRRHTADHIMPTQASPYQQSYPAFSHGTPRTIPAVQGLSTTGMSMTNAMQPNPYAIPATDAMALSMSMSHPSAFAMDHPLSRIDTTHPLAHTRPPVSRSSTMSISPTNNRQSPNNVYQFGGGQHVPFTSPGNITYPPLHVPVDQSNDLTELPALMDRIAPELLEPIKDQRHRQHLQQGNVLASFQPSSVLGPDHSSSGAVVS